MTDRTALAPAAPSPTELAESGAPMAIEHHDTAAAAVNTAGLTRRTVVAGGLLAVLVGTAFSVVLLAIDEMRQSAVLARHSETVLAAANRLERLLIDIETGQRGFLITGDERFLDPWNDARTSFPQQASALERLAAARSPEQGRRAERIAQGGASYIQDYSVPTVEATRRDRRAVLTVSTTEAGRQRVDALRAEFDHFGAFEDQLAATRQERAQSAARRATFAGTAGVAGSILLVSIFTGYLTRTIVRPVRRAAAMASQLAAGDFAVRLPDTGAAEIGALERAFNTMGASLEASHTELRRLVEEQAALRRVATLVARAVPPAELFDAVCGEVARLLEAPATRLLRFEPDGTATAVAGWGERGGPVIGTRYTPDAEGAVAAVLRTGRAARLEDIDRHLGPTALVRTWGLRSTVAEPIVVEGRVWGVMAAAWTESGRLPEGAEARLAQFTELVATAIANADSRVELAASRARVVAAADEARRRIERDLHDGTQQRLVSLALDLRAAEVLVPAELAELRAQVSRAANGLAGAVDELQEVSRGIHPAILSRGGVGAALKVLARRSSVPVHLDLSVDRPLPEPVQVAAYYLVSEALTNVAKHAQASAVRVQAVAAESSFRLSITDDGVGGAMPGQGSGLIGLRDRIEALGGSIEIASPPGKGTTLLAEIPVAG
jgi:signal transduction histidine kinase